MIDLYRKFNDMLKIDKREFVQKLAGSAFHTEFRFNNNTTFF